MRLPAVLTALITVLALASCSDDDADGDSGGSDGSSGGTLGERAEAALPSEPCATTAPEGDDGLTAPGSYLCLGVPAVVTVANRKDESEHGTAEITLTGVEQAPSSARDELDGLGVAADDVEGRDLWFFTFEARLLSENEPGGLDGFAPFDFADGGPWTAADDVTSTITFTDVTGCPSESFETGADEDEPVEEISYCRWWLVGEDDTVHGLSYSPVFLDQYVTFTGGEPVYWSTSESPEDSYVNEG